MKTIHRHISADFLITFLITLVVFTFVMCLGVVFKANDLLAKGVSWGLVFRIVMCGVPAILSYSLPISVMISSLLVFGRLSSDGEITAMRACGISLWEIASRPLMFAALLSALCVYVHCELAPKSHFARRTLKTRLGVDTPIELLDKGRYIRDFKGLTIFIGGKDHDKLKEVRVYDTRKDMKREVRASWGRIMPTKQGDTNVVVNLYDVRVDAAYKGGESVFMDTYMLFIPGAVDSGVYKARDEDLLMGQLWARRNYWPYPELDDEGREKIKMALSVEFNKRLVLSVSCFAFVFMGIPLGIKAHRKESSVGIGIGLMLFFCFYLFVIIAENLAEKPEFRPDIIVWVPVFLSFILGSKLISRAN